MFLIYTEVDVRVDLTVTWMRRSACIFGQNSAKSVTVHKVLLWSEDEHTIVRKERANCTYEYYIHYIYVFIMSLMFWSQDSALFNLVNSFRYSYSKF